MRLALRGLALMLIWSAIARPAAAQQPLDVPRDHWAYEAVNDLAAKGLIKGYPPDNRFLGERTVTRYEMAVIIQRALARVEELLRPREGAREALPRSVDQTQIENLRRLVEEFRTELTVIRTDLQQARSQISELRAMIESARADAAAARKTAEETRGKTQELADRLTLLRGEYQALQKNYNARKLSGYIQARFEGIVNDGGGLFSEAGSGGAGNQPSTGGPAVGGPDYGFLVRRARAKFAGQLTARTEWALQADFPSTGPVAIKDAFVNVSDLPLPKNTVLSFGLFPPPFGYELPHSASTRESPERAFGFSDSTASAILFNTSTGATPGGAPNPGSVLPLFLNQDRDVGVAVAWMAPDYLKPTTRIALGLFNGEGRTASGQRNTNRHLDLVGRAETSLLHGTLDLGVSGYWGKAAVRSGPPAGSPATPQPFVNANRIYGGIYARWTSPWKTVFRAEWMGGEHEMTPDRAQFLDGNHAQAYYIAVRHPFSARFEGALKYDEYYPVAAGNTFAHGLGRPKLLRRTLQGGILYNLDSATRFRLWYAQALDPFDVNPALPAGSPRTRKLGLLTGEIQVRY